MCRDKVVELAKFYAAKGFLCSESVLLAISDCLEIRNELIPKVATGFGAGMGGRGLVCGAISGGIIALGLKFGRDNVRKQKINPYWFAFELLEQFEGEFGYVTCRELTGCDFTTEAGRRKYTDGKLWEAKCCQYIGSVTAIVFDLIFERTIEIDRALRP
ncbi:MAG: C-GCAxxG-C-C family protein [Candidatus Bathyarchaeota archaeon]|nr:C-GCAxxG-C-C family protein [Candidatus Bathyarchaeota archaeon]MDH5494251.1 C-GCAxxG-C-C family protein [Candidatus Bathyarchaeota archaeon]